jgi:hypothetical protein
MERISTKRWVEKLDATGLVGSALVPVEEVP